MDFLDSSCDRIKTYIKPENLSLLFLVGRAPVQIQMSEIIANLCASSAAAFPFKLHQGDCEYFPFSSACSSTYLICQEACLIIKKQRIELPCW